LSASVIAVVLLLLCAFVITAIEEDVAENIIASLLAILFSDAAISLFAIANVPLSASFALWTL